MFRAIAKRGARWLAVALLALGYRGYRALARAAVRAEVNAKNVPDPAAFRRQLLLALKFGVLSSVLMACAIHWNWTRLQINGRLSDRLVKDVVAEREIREAPEPRPSWAKPGHYERFRCVVPLGAGAGGLQPYLKPAALSSARAWIETSIPGLGGDWWIVDTLDGRISKMSRMDKAILQPHPRMKEAQCVSANAMKFINSGVNAQGVQEFQVMGLGGSATY